VTQMDAYFVDDILDRLETDPNFTAGFAHALVKAFRKKMQLIRAARDERDLRAMKSLHFEKLKGSRRHQYSIRLNDQYRLIVELEEHAGSKKVKIVGIEDYH